MCRQAGVAMHAVQQLEPSQHGLTATDHPVLRNLMANPAIACAEEVRVLCQRLALPKAELAATKATVSAPRHRLKSTWRNGRSFTPRWSTGSLEAGYWSNSPRSQTSQNLALEPFCVLVCHPQGVIQKMLAIFARLRTFIRRSLPIFGGPKFH
jgi:hypothetical protein